MVVNQPPENGTCILKKRVQAASTAGPAVWKYNATDGKAMLDIYSIK